MALERGPGVPATSARCHPPYWLPKKWLGSEAGRYVARTLGTRHEAVRDSSRISGLKPMGTIGSAGRKKPSQRVPPPLPQATSRPPPRTPPLVLEVKT